MFTPKFRPNGIAGAALLLMFVLAPQGAGALDDRDVEVLSALIVHGLEANTPLVVIAGRTTGDPAAIAADDAVEDAIAGGLGVPLRALENWARRNAAPHPIERALDLPVSYQMLDDETLGELFDDVDPQTGWQHFFERFPGAPGIVRLSQPGYDDSLSQALVYVEHQCGAECGAGRLVALSRDDAGVWRVDGGAIVWMSE